MIWFWVGVLIVSGLAIVYFGKQLYRDWRDIRRER